MIKPAPPSSISSHASDSSATKKSDRSNPEHNSPPTEPVSHEKDTSPPSATSVLNEEAVPEQPPAENSSKDASQQPPAQPPKPAWKKPAADSVVPVAVDWPTLDDAKQPGKSPVAASSMISPDFKPASDADKPSMAKIPPPPTTGAKGARNGAAPAPKPSASSTLPGSSTAPRNPQNTRGAEGEAKWQQRSDKPPAERSSAPPPAPGSAPTYGARAASASTRSNGSGMPGATSGGVRGGRGSGGGRGGLPSSIPPLQEVMARGQDEGLDPSPPPRCPTVSTPTCTACTTLLRLSGTRRRAGLPPLSLRARSR